MSVFEKRLAERRNPATRLGSRAALALAAMSVIAADGVIEDEEVDALHRLLQGDQAAYDQAWALFEEITFGECVEIVSSALDEQQRLTAIANLLDLAMVDGRIDDDEKMLLDAYIESFVIPGETLNAMVDVMLVKNDLSVFA